MKSISATTLAWLVVSLAARAQQPAAASTAQKTQATYQGCVTKVPGGEHYLLATADRCILLNGDYKQGDVVNHLALFQGMLLEPTDTYPLTLMVEKTLKVAHLCTQTCKLQPPGSRGLHGKEKPGSEGGPPGLNNPPPPR